LDRFLEPAKRKPGESYVNLIIHHVSSSLLNDFAKFVVQPYYPRGISTAIKDFMRKAVEEQKQRVRSTPVFEFNRWSSFK